MSDLPVSSRIPVTPAYISWGDPVNDPPSALGSLSFDVVVSEEHERSSVVTDHSVERGVNIVDHVRPMPDRVTLDVYVSNSPINSPDAAQLPLTLDIPQPGDGTFLAGGTGALLGAAAAAFSGPEGDPSNPRSSLQRFLGLTGGLPTSLTASVQQFTGDQDYVRNAYDTLTTLRDTATLLNVITPRAKYTSMILEKIQLHRDSGVGTGGRFTLEFREILIVSSSIVQAPAGGGVSANGMKDPSTAAQAKASLAKNALNKAGLSVLGSGL